MLFKNECFIFSILFIDFGFLNVSSEIEWVTRFPLTDKLITKHNKINSKILKGTKCRESFFGTRLLEAHTHLAFMPDALISLWINVVRCQGEADQPPFQTLGFNLFQCLLSYEVCGLQECKIMMMNECSDIVTRLEMQAFKFVFAIFSPITHEIKKYRLAQMSRQ